VYDPKTGGTREAPDHQIVNGRMVPMAAAARGGGLKVWLREHLRLVALIADHVKENGVLIERLRRIGLLRRDRPSALSGPARLEHLWGASGMVSLLRDAPPAIEEAWHAVIDHLDAMSTACRARGIPMAVVVIPYKVQTVPEARRKEEVFLALAESDLDVEQPGRRVQAWGRARGVPIIDLLPVFRHARDPASLYFRVDVHWNDKGHEVAGHVLADRLLALGLIPAASSPDAGIPTPPR
jgi:hypothetical protein